MVTSRGGKKARIGAVRIWYRGLNKEFEWVRGRQCTLGNALGKILNASSLLMQSNTGEGPSEFNELPPSGGKCLVRSIRDSWGGPRMRVQEFGPSSALAMTWAAETVRATLKFIA